MDQRAESSPTSRPVPHRRGHRRRPALPIAAAWFGLSAAGAAAQCPGLSIGQGTAIPDAPACRYKMRWPMTVTQSLTVTFRWWSRPEGSATWVLQDEGNYSYPPGSYNNEIFHPLPLAGVSEEWRLDYIVGACSRQQISTASIPRIAGFSFGTPSSVTVCGEPAARLSAMAQIGAGVTVSSVWNRDGVPVNTADPRVSLSSTPGPAPGDTILTLAIANPVAGDAGNYTVTLSGPCGAVTSGTAMLSIAPSSGIRIIDLGALPGAGSSVAGGLSADGLVAVGGASAPGANHAFRWTCAEGMQSIGFPAGASSASATSVNADGGVITGLSYYNPGPYRAFRWTSTNGMTDLGALPGQTASIGWGVSADGSVVVGESSGLSSPRAFRWTAGSGMTDLGTPPSATSSRAVAVSADGATVAGNAVSQSGYSYPWRWRPGFSVPAPLGGDGYAQAISADGSTIVGRGEGALASHLFRWSDAVLMQDLGELRGSGPQAAALAVSAEGSVVLGASANAQACLWRQDLGLRTLESYLLTHGGAGVLQGWTGFTQIRGISTDGLTILGDGTRPNGWDHAFVAHLPESLCAPSVRRSAENVSVCAAGPAVFSVRFADGGGTAQFQWTRNGQPIDPADPRIATSVVPSTGGERIARLSIVALTPADRGIYACTGSNACGAATSLPATLTICRTDADCAGGITVSDVAVFVNTWFASVQDQTLAGDFDGSGTVEPADIAVFVGEWFGELAHGC